MPKPERLATVTDIRTRREQLSPDQVEDIRRRLAEIPVHQAALESERKHLERRLARAVVERCDG